MMFELFWDHFGIELGSLRDNIEIIFGSFRDRFGISLGSVWHYLGSVFDQCGFVFPWGGGAGDRGARSGLRQMQMAR